MGFFFENFPIKPETVQKLLKVFDDHITEHFFSSNGLAELGWCTKYLMESTICINKNAHDSDKFKKLK